MLKIGEQIYSSKTRRTYTITSASEIVANAEVGFASAGEGEYFIKKHVRNKYPTDDAPLSPEMKKIRREKCNAEYKKNAEVYEAIRRGCGEEGACVPILDYFREYAFYYTVYKKINANSLSLNDISSLSREKKYTLLLSIVQGLMPLHSLGVIHGDLKPDNILVQREGDNWKIRLIDLDDCYRVGQPKEPGAILGTLDYYSPELAKYNTYEVDDWGDTNEMAIVNEMAQDLTLKSDIFALGIIFCEFYGGEKPKSKDEDLRSIYEAALEGCLELPSSVSCDTKISTLVKKMLEGDFRERPTLRQVGDDLHKIIQNKLEAPEIKFEALDEEGNLFKCFISTYSDGTVRYTLDGSEPTATSEKYKSPIQVIKNTMVKAIVTDEKRKSAVSYKIAWLKRPHSLQPKIVVKDRYVTIRLNEGSPSNTQIFYTLDGTNPSKKSALYSETFIAPDGITKIKSIAVEPGAIPSRVVEANVYKMRIRKPDIHYKQGVVSMESSQGYDIYYTLDGSSPSKSSCKYICPFEIEDKSQFHIMAVCIDNEGRISDIIEIKRPSSKILFSHSSG